MPEGEFTCEARWFRNGREYEDWFRIRSAGFSEWYVPPRPTWSLTSNRHTENARAALFPDFFHQVRASSGRVVAYLATVPGYWPADVGSLHTFDYVDKTLHIGPVTMTGLTSGHVVLARWLHAPGAFERLTRRWRARRTSGANAVCLIAISVDPEFRKQQLAARLVGAAERAARRLGFAYVIAPFRPNDYGQFKAARRVGHSDALFADYCRLTNDAGLPVDPWLRTVVRLGARLVKPVPRSCVIERSIAEFERFRESHRPADWYSPSPDVWECGETHTWYVDRARGVSVSVEPNYWGVIDLTCVCP
jgi:GNAT superfamily N-acetyltransferase